jgi:translation initiation factor IF-2
MMKKSEQQKSDNLQPRPPVVVVLGHVDHGKTTLLDFVRKTKVAEKESGGITQHIGAYEVVHQGKKITFIDTPGHEAFSAIRSRGARVADIAILVVAAEEGIKLQTKEAILHVKKAGIPLIVAINKIDKSEANPEKVKRELAKEDILVESMGGKVPFVLTSAKTGQGLDALLELILIVAEMEELKGDIKKPAQGVVIEAYLDNQRGPCATLLLRDGILQVGDLAVTSTTLGKIKVLEDFQGKPQDKALPSMPCVVIGFEKVPQVGEKFEVYDNLESAQKYIEEKGKKMKSGEVFFAEEGKKVLNLILKADVLGSIEAVREITKNLPQDKVILRILKAEVGEINENDVKLAKSSSAKILGFRVKASPIALTLAERDNVKIMTFDIIYELAQVVRQLMEKAVTPEKSRVDLGKVKVLVIFHSEKNRQVLGGKVIEGEVKKGASLEVFRENGFLGKGKVINLQKNKKDRDVAQKGDECGLLYEGDVKVAEGDMLQVYETRSKSQPVD